jgi:hypothetical protein
MTILIYKVVKMFKHKEHGWLKFGRFVKCRPEFAKNYVIRRELIRCFSDKQDSVDALWIDNVPEPKEEKKEIKPMVRVKPKQRKIKK